MHLSYIQNIYSTNFSREMIKMIMLESRNFSGERKRFFACDDRLDLCKNEQNLTIRDITSPENHFLIFEYIYFPDFEEKIKNEIKEELSNLQNITGILEMMLRCIASETEKFKNNTDNFYFIRNQRNLFTKEVKELFFKNSSNDINSMNNYFLFQIGYGKGLYGYKYILGEVNDAINIFSYNWYRAKEVQEKIDAIVSHFSTLVDAIENTKIRIHKHLLNFRLFINTDSENLRAPIFRIKYNLKDIAPYYYIEKFSRFFLNDKFDLKLYLE